MISSLQKSVTFMALTSTLAALTACSSGSSSSRPSASNPETGDPNDAGVIYITAKDEEAGVRVWQTDGTAENTLPIFDLDENSANGMIRSVDHLGGKLYISSDESGGLYIYDLTEKTKTQVTVHADSEAGKTIDHVYIADATRPTFVSFQNKPHFLSTVLPEGCGLWSIESDGKAKLLTTFTSSCPWEQLVVGNRLYFSVQDTNNRQNLGYWDGSSMHYQEIIADDQSFPESFVEHNGDLYFIAQAAAGTPSKEIFKMASGSSAPVAYVTDRDTHYSISSYSSLYFVDNILYYTAGNEDENALWSFNGTASTKILPELGTFETNAYTSILWKNKIYARGASDTAGYEPFVADESGLNLLKDIKAGNDSSYPSYFIPCGVRLCFGADGGSGRELYSTDGTSEGTSLVKDINAGSNDSGAPFYYVWWD